MKVVSKYAVVSGQTAQAGGFCGGLGLGFGAAVSKGFGRPCAAHHIFQAWG
jgi:hypothetical protein